MVLISRYTRQRSMVCCRAGSLALRGALGIALTEGTPAPGQGRSPEGVRQAASECKELNPHGVVLGVPAGEPWLLNGVPNSHATRDCRREGCLIGRPDG